MIRTTLRRLCGLCLCAALLCAAAPTASAAAFKDVPEGHWAYAEIERCAELGLFAGGADGRFGLGQPMTRAALVAVLGRMFGWEAQAPAHTLFTDVPANAWYGDALQAACERGVIARQEDTFRPGDPVTREELAAILVRAMGCGALAAGAAEEALPFRDVRTNPGYIAVAYRLGLVKGINEVQFAPDRAATREQTAVMLMRMYDKLHAALPQMNLLAPGETLPEDWSGDAAALSACTLLPVQSPILTDRMDAQEEQAAIEAVHAHQAAALLHLSVRQSVVTGDARTAAARIAERVEARGYDGLLIEPEGKSNMKWLLSLLGALRKLLPEQHLAVAVDAPPDTAAASIQALSAAADRVVLRVPALQEQTAGFPIAAPEPPEALYAALTELAGQSGKLTLRLTLSGSVWEDGRKVESLTPDAVAALVQNGAAAYSSEQYGCAYLQQDGRTVWYMTAEGVAARICLAACLGVSGVCFDSPSAPAA